MQGAEFLRISSPKRSRGGNVGWSGFFPYYAGYPATFARGIIESARLNPDATVLDPWNGSGTTTQAASITGFNSIGIDLNPVMVIVARARLLAPSEADSLIPLATNILAAAVQIRVITPADPLEVWFSQEAAAIIRSIEIAIREYLLGSLTLTPKGARLDRMSGLAAVHYVALFALLRSFTHSFRTSNPTWLRQRREDDVVLNPSREAIASLFITQINSMRSTLLKAAGSNAIGGPDPEIRLGNAADAIVSGGRADFVLTSPPYCTRIDYTSATRVELALLQPMLTGSIDTLRRQMTGSPLSPRETIVRNDSWGRTCNKFLDSVIAHKSRASSGYYYNTHLDYFTKMQRSIVRTSASLKSGGLAVFVVQDSFYKDIHNDLPRIISEMADLADLGLVRREDFAVRTMASIHPGASTYRRDTPATEAVLCFRKA